MKTASSARLVRRISLNKTSRIYFFHHPQIARRGKPGQFVQILTTPDIEPFLRRPMSILATEPAKDLFSVLFAIVGSGTEHLAQLTAGDEVAVLGPLGNTFSLPRSCKQAILVAGGVGLPPLDFWARHLTTKGRKSGLDITMLVGARTDAERLRLPRLKTIRRLSSTDDGSAGFHGNVVELLQKVHGEKQWPASETMIYGCGPKPMLQALQEWLLKNKYAGQLSLEEIMACGFGVCSGCVVASRPEREGYEKFVRVCYDGPVFDAREVAW